MHSCDLALFHSHIISIGSQVGLTEFYQLTEKAYNTSTHIQIYDITGSRYTLAAISNERLSERDPWKLLSHRIDGPINRWF